MWIYLKYELFIEHMNTQLCIYIKLCDTNWLWILKVLDSYLTNHPTDDFIPWIWFNIELFKSCKHSLFNIEKHRWLPLWNVFSQFFANVYLSEFDFFIKVKLWLRYYIRYADDFVIIHEDLDYLKQLKKDIKKYLKNQLDLELSINKTYIKDTKKGVRFLWKRFFWYDRYKLISYFYDKFNSNLNQWLLRKKDLKSVIFSYMW